MPDRRIARANHLAERFPASREVLAYYAHVAAFSGNVHDLAALARHAPAPLRQALRNLDGAALREATQAYLRGADLKSPLSHYARLLLRHAPPAPPAHPSPHRCPRCGQPPQCGVLDPEGDGLALSLVCSLCQTEWRFRRGRCPACGVEDTERVYCYHAEDIRHIDTQVCEGCTHYLHLIHRDREPQAIPEVDELVALPLDVMCLDYGFVKIHPNLAGV
jgi:formate dehydrogenase maturation protein FdhE